MEDTKEDSHFSILTVGTVQDVLLSVQKWMPDLLPLDVALSDISGLTVLEKMRWQMRTPKTIFSPALYPSDS